jgi:hypothetical protein
MSLSAEGIALVHLAMTAAMGGLIWFVQIVHYPLFASVGDDSFQGWHARHTARTSLVVGPLMLGELLCALWLAVRPPYAGPLAWIGLALLAIIWASTGLVQVPLHGRLAEPRDRAADQKRLVATNWIRTIAWTLRVVIAWGLAASV